MQMSRWIHWQNMLCQHWWLLPRQVANDLKTWDQHKLCLFVLLINSPVLTLRTRCLISSTLHLRWHEHQRYRPGYQLAGLEIPFFLAIKIKNVTIVLFASVDPCLNGATCVDDIDSYQCLCVNGFSGKQCQLEIDECESDPCQNGATCVNYVDSFVCTCMVRNVYLLISYVVRYWSFCLFY